MILLLAAITLLWEFGPETAASLKQAGIQRIAVAQSSASAWSNSGAGITVEPHDTSVAIKLATPAMKMRSNMASATRSPWVDSNGWRIIRQPEEKFIYSAPGRTAALAYAEAFVYGADAYIQTDADGLDHFARMQKFCAEAGASSLPTAANIGVIDDGSPASGEVMNLMIRRNLLYKIVAKPDPNFALNITLATYPKADEKDPSALAQRIRSELGDEKRLVRVYGSEVVIARLLSNSRKGRLYLLNYSSRPVEGVRIRVGGRWTKHSPRVYAINDAKALDYTTDAGATEFTLAELPVLAIIDLEN